VTIARHFKSCATQFDRKFLVILWCINNNRFLHSLIAELITCMYLPIILSSWQSMMFISLSFSIISIICRCHSLSMSSPILLMLLSITAVITSLQRFTICCCSWFKSSEQSLWCRHLYWTSFTLWFVLLIFLHFAVIIMLLTSLQVWASLSSVK